MKMAQKKTFAVIGLGRFGLAVVEELISSGYDVLVIDRNQDRIAKVAKLATHAVVLDTADESALRDVGITSIDHVIVAIGKDVEDSIMTTLILKEIGVKKITVKVQNYYHEKVVHRLGADETIQPERITGKRLAHRIVSNNMLEFYDLSKNHSFVEMEVTSKIVNTTVANLDLRDRFHVNLVAIKRGEDIVIPKPEETFEATDHLLLVGKNEDLNKFSTWSEK